MTTVTVLSPHRDDAAFSLFCCLSEWRRCGAILRVLNFFTLSAYAPQANSEDTIAISDIRKREDRKALRLINPAIERVDFDLLDAPLRLKIELPSVCQKQTWRLIQDAEIQALAFRLRRMSTDMIVAPLALGDHVDHWTVQQAAIRAPRTGSIAFYEDLPYATWTSPEQLGDRVREVERQLGTKLHPVMIRTPYATFQKRRAVGQYQSQIEPEMAGEIARWSRHFGGGERLWMSTAAREVQRRLCG